jgi:stearoyl-CoA desaturase (delta-9 desaturase)
VTLATLLDNIQWVSFLALTVTPTLAAIGLFTTPVQAKTVAWSVIYYFMTGLGITAGEFASSLAT